MFRARNIFSDIKKAQPFGFMIKLSVLFILSLILFHREVFIILSSITKSSEYVHAVAAALAIIFLIYLRRKALIENMSKGSMWGFVLIFFGISIYTGTTWPFNFGYARDIAIVPVLGGIILLINGWRVLKLLLPMLLLILISIPIGKRLMASLVLYPEKYTIHAVAAILDGIPSLITTLKGYDLYFSSDHSSGVIGLGESYRAARLFLAFLTIGVFVVFSEIRSPVRVAIAAVATIPILLFCNLIRFLSWSLITIYISQDPASSIPRTFSTIISLFLAYALFAVVANFKINLFIDSEEKEKSNDIVIKSSPANISKYSLIKSVLDIRFILASIILISAIFGVHPFAELLAEKYTKIPIAPRRSLKTFDVSALPSFKSDWKCEEKSVEVGDASLGTSEYINLLVRIPGENTKGIFLTYYSDPNNKVPHEPPMCYAQKGAIIIESSEITIDTPQLSPAYPQVEACLALFQLPKTMQKRIVIYCFCAEGQFAISRNQVRWIIGKPGYKHSYFSKVEVFSECKGQEDIETAVEECKKLFREVITVLLRDYLPTQESLRN